MTTKDGFPPDDRYPVFLSEDAEQAEQPDIGKAWRRAAIWSRILKTGILVVAAAAIGIAIVSVGNPVALLANVTASLVDKSALQPGTDPSTPTIQANAGTQDLPPPAGDAPMRDETAAARETEISQPPAEGLLKQFQAWAAEEDTRAQAGPVQPVQDAQAQVVQGAPAQVAQDALAQVRPMRRHRQVRHVQNARARDPARATTPSKGPPGAYSPSKGPAGAGCTGTGPARARRPSTGPVGAKCPATVAPAGLRFAQLGLAGSDALQDRARLAKTIPK